MKIRLYMDEDSMREVLVESLQARGVDVLTALDAETIGWSDQEQLDYATEQGRVLCSFNIADFNRLHAEYMMQGKSHVGIILVQQQRYTLGEQMRRMLKIIAAKPAETMENHIEFLSALG